MAQNWNIFTAFWMNTATAPGTPLTGLSATINIRDLSGTLVVNAQAMSELGGGWYIYTFTGYDNQKEYVYDCNPGATAYIESGVTDKRLDHIDKNISDISASGGGGFSSQGIQTSIGNMGRSISKKMEEEHTKTRKLIIAENNETNSHIELAKSDTIYKIESIEQAEIDTTEIVKSIGVIKAQNTKLANYIKGEEEKEKTEIEKKHKKMMDDMESAYAEMEKENWKVVSEKDKEKESIMKDADEIIESLEWEIKIAWENAIAEIKTLLK